MSKRSDHATYFRWRIRKVFGQFEFSLHHAVRGIALFANRRSLKTAAVDAFAMVVVPVLTTSPAFTPLLGLIGEKRRPAQHLEFRAIAARAEPIGWQCCVQLSTVRTVEA